MIIFNASILTTGQGEVLVLGASKEGSLKDVGRESIESENQSFDQLISHKVLLFKC